MATAIKVSDSLADHARVAAADADRSLTGQIEHWSRLGRSLEPLFNTPMIAALKNSDGDLASIVNSDLRQRIFQTLEHLRLNPPYAKALEALESSNQPLYEADSDDEERVVQVYADGRKVKGRFIDRVFTPDP